jgi:hypothetical protein
MGRAALSSTSSASTTSCCYDRWRACQPARADPVARWEATRAAIFAALDAPAPSTRHRPARRRTEHARRMLAALTTEMLCIPGISRAPPIIPCLRRDLDWRA